MVDPRVEAYARLGVERCLGVQPGWQVLMRASPPARPLVEELLRRIGRRGAYALLRLSFAPPHANLIFAEPAWLESAPEALVAELAPVERHLAEHVDAAIGIDAPERPGDDHTNVDDARRRLMRGAVRPFLERLTGGALPTAYCLYPTPAFADAAGVPLAAYEALLFAACLVDPDELRAAGERLAGLLDRAGVVRLLAPGTDLTVGLSGQPASVDDGRRALPGGEVSLRPARDTAEGVLGLPTLVSLRPARDTAEGVLGLPTLVRRRDRIEGARLVFRAGRVVEATARTGQDELRAWLAGAEDAGVLYGLHLGCNPRVDRFTDQFGRKKPGVATVEVGPSYPLTLYLEFGRLEADGTAVALG